jgi:hypothetical protein
LKPAERVLDRYINCHPTQGKLKPLSKIRNLAIEVAFSHFRNDGAATSPRRDLQNRGNGVARLAVVIGVSENLPPFKSLGACANDGAAMAAVLKETGRFDDILLLCGKDETTSKMIKNRLANFIGKHKGSSVEELVFYFSGHGEFAGDEFYHILSDYDASTRNQTSLANSELDGMMAV